MTDTIIAPATTPGTGAISLVRISGPDCFRYTDAVVQLKRGTISESDAYTIHFGSVAGLDDVLVSVFRAPHSYTGEDSVEISCHASRYVVEELIRKLLSAGCRMAAPGEFTRRAFMNGKMDLAQAEAVADLISSTTEASHRVAYNQLKGGYSARLGALREELVEMTSLLELELDFSEEDVEFADRSRLLNLVDRTRSHVESLADTFKLGNAIRSGVPVAIIGGTNVGKSTLLNALIGDDRALVSEVAGTTRDTVEEVVNLEGILFRFIDTAGIRRKNKVTEDLEFYSVMRSIRSIENSDVCILMIDATRGIEAQDLNIFQIIQKNQKSLVVVVNKWDLVPDKDTKVMKTMENAIRERMAPFTDFPVIFGSALTKQRIFRVLETAKEVYLNRTRKVTTHKLNEEMLPLIEAYPPPSMKGKYIKIKYCMQIPDTRIPSFVFYANLPQYVKEPYKRFLENKIRERWNFSGCPINVFVRQK